jgi:hypothetical protein
MSIQSKDLSKEALSILLCVQAHNETKGVIVNLDDIAADVQLTAAYVRLQLERLNRDGLVDAQVSDIKALDDATWRVVVQITGAGLRALRD